ISLDWIHFMAVSVWVGGLFYISSVLLVLVKSHVSIDLVRLNREIKDKSLSSLEGKNTNEIYVPRSIGDYFLALLLPRFSLLATISLGIIGVSGLYMAWLHLHSFNALFDTPYGIILIIKLLTVLPVVVLGGYHQITLHNYMVKIESLATRDDKSKTFIASLFNKEKKKQPRLISAMRNVIGNGRLSSFNARYSYGNRNKSHSKGHENRIDHKNHTCDTYSRFSKTIKIESIIAIVVLFVASILTITSPPSMNMSSSMMMMGGIGKDNMNTDMVLQNQSSNNGQKATTMVVVPGITGNQLSSNSSIIKNLNLSTQKAANNSYSAIVKILDTNIKTEINPLYAGFNTFKIAFKGMDGQPAKNISNVVMQFTNDQANIGPIIVNLNKISEGVYSIFGGYLSQKGNWSVQTTAQRTGAYDLNNEFNVNVPSRSTTPSASLSSVNTTTLPSSNQQQKISVTNVDSNNTMNPSESPPSFDSFAILAIVLSVLVISASVYFFKKNKQQLNETIFRFEEHDGE
ncbi:MAG: CopD family protein, partial [Thermoproteota archaeon]|nr:CopD family protein [Thermoproteota archaeon]